MEKDKLISFITSNQSPDNDPEVVEWINTTEDNKEEYIRYKNLWAILQPGNMPETKIQEALSRIKESSTRKKSSLWFLNFMKYAALVITAVLGGYLLRTIDLSNKITMNEVYVPNGNRSSVVLPDGTKVWLNNGTKLVYPDDFKGKDRIVELEGEGFFDVTHDKKHPFIVKVGENRIKVLGTKFAIVAYPQDKYVTAELVSGQIQFDIRDKNQTDKFYSYVMKPSQSLIFDKSSGKISASRIKDSFYNYWLNGVFEFRDETLEELAKKIERIYNVEVTFDDESLKMRLFSGTLSINDNIFTIMEVLKKASGKPFVYEHEGNHIRIKRGN